MASKDYYAILGVEKNATEAQIKTAFRKLAKRYHPDLHPGDKSSENKFKEGNEAYEVLSDKQKRAQYDQIREAEAHGFSGFGGESPQGGGRGFNAEDLNQYGDLGDIFSSMFGGGGFGRGSTGFGAAQGEDLNYEVEIPFERAVHGGTTILSISKRAVCSTCHGSGAEPGTKTQTCQQCQGRGVIQMGQGGFAISRPCPRCGGRGRIILTSCSECHGVGEVNKIRKLRINIPIGVDDGTKIRIPNEGQPGPNNSPPGDLYVTFRIQNHEIFERKGKDIYMEVPINAFQAMLGTEIEVQTLHGKVKMKVPAGTQHGTLLRLKSQGVAQRQGLEKGDQFVRIKVTIPRNLTPAQRKEIEELASSMNLK
jgi:molecular chaperone DnaJ